MVQEELVQLGEEVAIMFRMYATKVIASTVLIVFVFNSNFNHKVDNSTHCVYMHVEWN